MGKRVFTVMLDGTDVAEDEPVIAREAAGLPRIGAPFPGDAEMRVRTIGLPRNIGLHQFEFDVTYERTNFGDDPDANSPLDQPVTISWSTQSRTEPFDRDVRSGDPIVNTVGDPFDPPLPRPVAVDVLTMVRNEEEYDAIAMRQFKNHTNSSSFWGAGEDQAYCADITAEKIQEGQVTFWRVRYEFWFIAEDADSEAPLEWNARVLNQGLRYWTGIFLNVKGIQTKEIQPVTDPHGNPASQPVRLAADGSQLAPNGEPTGAIFLTFDRYRQADLDLLGLPTE